MSIISILKSRRCNYEREKKKREREKYERVFRDKVGFLLPLVTPINGLSFFFSLSLQSIKGNLVSFSISLSH